MIILGVDPGLSGAIACLHTRGELIAVHDMPTLALSRGGKNKRELDAHRLAALIGEWRIGHAFVEQVWSMPGQGVSGMFSMGKSYGIVIGILAALGVPYTFIAAAKWKKSLGVPADKDGARERASQVMPQAAVNWPLKKHDGRAEATLIALYGLRSLNAIADPEQRLEPAERTGRGA